MLDSVPGYTTSALKSSAEAHGEPDSAPAFRYINGATAMSAVAALIVVIVVAAFYFLPYLVASRRGKRNQNAILVLHLFLGWTLVGWVLAAAAASKYEAPPNQPQSA